MDFENEKKQEETPKDGFQREQREFRPGRSPRPRIHSGQRPAYERPSYNNHEEDEGGFRPEGFGAGLQSGTPQRPSYRPRTGGYNQQGGYNRQPREGGYNRQPREGGFLPRQGGYNGNRPAYGAPQRGGFQPRQPREGGYNQQGGYQSRGYQPRPESDYGQKPRSGYNPNYPNKPYKPFKKNVRPHSADYDPNAKYSMKKRIEYKEVNYDPNEPLRLNKYLMSSFRLVW